MRELAFTGKKNRVVWLTEDGVMFVLLHGVKTATKVNSGLTTGMNLSVQHGFRSGIPVTPRNDKDLAKLLISLIPGGNSGVTPESSRSSSPFFSFSVSILLHHYLRHLQIHAAVLFLRSDHHELRRNQAPHLLQLETTTATADPRSFIAGNLLCSGRLLQLNPDLRSPPDQSTVVVSNSPLRPVLLLLRSRTRRHRRNQSFAFAGIRTGGNWETRPDCDPRPGSRIQLTRSPTRVFPSPPLA